MRPFQDVSQCLPRDTHLFGSLFLIQPFKVGQANRLQLVLCQLDGFELLHRHAALRLEMRGVQAVLDLSSDLWSWHGVFVAYARNHIHSFFSKKK